MLQVVCPWACYKCFLKNEENILLELCDLRRDIKVSACCMGFP